MPNTARARVPGCRGTCPAQKAAFDGADTVVEAGVKPATSIDHAVKYATKPVMPRQQKNLRRWRGQRASATATLEMRSSRAARKGAAHVDQSGSDAIVRSLIQSIDSLPFSSASPGSG